MVVVGIGIRPNTSLFEGQLTLEKGGIKVNGKLQSSNSSVYAVGDVAAFPVKLFGETLESSQCLGSFMGTTKGK
jgi:monodehydroascorbate reductase (NADH)